MSFRVDDTGVVHVAWRAGLALTEDLAADGLARLDALNGGDRRPLLVDMTGLATVTREARKVFSRPCTASRVALVGTSAVDRVIANFALAVGATPVPTRYFTSEGTALEWLCDGRGS